MTCIKVLDMCEYDFLDQTARQQGPEKENKAMLILVRIECKDHQPTKERLIFTIKRFDADFNSGNSSSKLQQMASHVFLCKNSASSSSFSSD